MAQRISGERTLMPTTEACKLAGLSQKHIQRLLRDKRIEGVKLGHDWLVYEDSLQSFLAQPRKPGPKGSRKEPVGNTPPVTVDEIRDGHHENGSDQS